MTQLKRVKQRIVLRSVETAATCYVELVKRKMTLSQDKLQIRAMLSVGHDLSKYCPA